MKQAGYHHTNHLAAEIREEIQHSQMQMLALAQNLKQEEEEEDDKQTNSANAVVQTSVQQQTNELLLSMQESLKLLAEQLKKDKTSKFKKRTNKKTPDNPPFSRTDTSKYCWTHGCCNHNSNECSRKAEGHKNEATKSNMMGGSKAFCA